MPKHFTCNIHTKGIMIYQVIFLQFTITLISYVSLFKVTHTNIIRLASNLLAACFRYRYLNNSILLLEEYS